MNRYNYSVDISRSIDCSHEERGRVAGENNRNENAAVDTRRLDGEKAKE